MAALNWFLPIGLQDGRAYLEGGKVNDTVNIGVSLEDLVEAILIGDIELDKLGLLAADSLDPIQGLDGGVV
jgi:hypothetical protein